MDAFWSVAAMPIGLFMCFTPIVIAWALMSLRKPAPSATERRDRH
jgi:hypothetical protein